jgi:hypothetical protein
MKFNDTALEDFFRLENILYVAQVSTRHHQISLFSACLLFFVSALFHLVEPRQPIISTIISGILTLCQLCLWVLRRRWFRKAKCKLMNEDNPYLSMGSFSEDDLHESDLNSVLDRIAENISKGVFGYFLSVSVFTGHLLVIIWLSESSSFLLAAEGLVYVNLVYVGFLDCAELGYLARVGTNFGFSGVLLAEMFVVGKLRIPGLFRVAAALGVMAVSMYFHTLSVKSEFLVGKVLKYSQSQSDKGRVRERLQFIHAFHFNNLIMT